MMSPDPSSPAVSGADWNAAAAASSSAAAASSSAALSSSAPSFAGLTLTAESVDAGLAQAKAHLAKLAAWSEVAQAELSLLKSMLQADSTVSADAYADFHLPYAAPFAQMDAATPIPAFGVPAAPSPTAAGSRLARAAQQSSGALGGLSGGAASSAASLSMLASLGPSLEELEERKNALATQIKLFQSDSGRKLDKSLEPPRNKCHWDYLLAEMEWMANDFVRERKWKQVCAKKLARAVETHHKREIGKEFRQLRDEVVQRRKRAAWVSRQIKKFWANIGKLVKHKHAASVEEAKKKQMGAHLETLVHQTESFSSKLAQDLTAKGAVAAPSKASPLAQAQAQVQAQAAATANASPFTPVPAPTPSPSSSPAPSAAAASPPDAAAEAADASAEDMNTDEVDVGKVDDILTNLQGPHTADARRSTRVHKLVAPVGAAVAAAAATDDAADADFAEESSEDDEGTLSDEEAKDDAEEGGSSRRAEAVKAEVSQLEAEAEMSIEELRKLYGGAGDEEEEEEEEQEEEEGGETGAETGDEQRSGGDAGSAAASTSASPAFGSGDDAAMADSSAEASGTGGGAADEGEDEEEEGDDNEGEESDDEGAGAAADAAAAEADAAADASTNTSTLLLASKGANTEEQRMTIASELAASAQPAGHTLADTKVKTKVPHLLRGPGPLREYQHIGLDWLVSMYENGLNGILAGQHNNTHNVVETGLSPSPFCPFC
jgi:hypothetical protein